MAKNTTAAPETTVPETAAPETTVPETAAPETAVPETAPYDPWKDMRTVFVPKMSRTEQSTLEVGVNDKTYFVPKEKMVPVPFPVWEVVEEMLKRRREMEEDAQKNSGVKEFGM